MQRRITGAWVASWLIAVISVRVAAVQTPSLPDPGAFTLYKLQQPVGRERYEVLRSGDSILIRTTAKLSFLGTDAPLEATLVLDGDFAPRRYTARGATSTITDVDMSVELGSDSARVFERGVAGTVPAPAGAFPINHYAPVAMRMMALQHWLSRGRPWRIPLLPSGELRVRPVGRDTVIAAGRVVALDRYSVRGLTWGLQTTWLDPGGRLVALVAGDAELDRFEAIAEGYEQGMPLFVRRAVEDGIAESEAVARRVPPVRAGRFAVVGARVLDVRSGTVVERGTVLIAGGRIEAVRPTELVPVPAGVPVVDGAGLTVIPGLWDMHGHYEQAEWPLVGLAAGVTTVRDAGNEFELVTALRDAIEEGRILGPRMVLAGVIDGGDHPMSVAAVGTPEAARGAVRRYHDARFQQIKIYQSVPPALVPVIADEAHRLGMTVTGHVPTGMNAFEFVQAGADQINHLNFVTAVMRKAPGPGQPPQPVDLASAEAREAIRFLVERRTVLDPSLARAEEFLHAKGRYSEVEPGVAKVPAELLGALNSTGVPPDRADRARATLVRSLGIVGALHGAGVRIVLGTDLAVPGHSIYRELELAVQAGLSPLDALRAATVVPAEVMGLGHESGTVEAGRRADLVLVDGDPLANISAIRRVRHVVANGRLFDAASLWRAAGFQP